MLRLSAVLLLGLLLAHDAAGAQQRLSGSELVPGTRVRIQAEGRAAIGGIHSLSRDTLVLTLWEQPGAWTVPLGSVRQLEVSTGRESRWSSAFRWGWRSALVFGGLMAATVGPVCADAAEGECNGFGAFLVQSGISGGLMGAIYGSFAPRERWITVPVSAGRPVLP